MLGSTKPKTQSPTLLRLLLHGLSFWLIEKPWKSPFARENQNHKTLEGANCLQRIWIKAIMEDAPTEFGDSNKDTEIAPALIAVHPAQDSVATAVGSDLRVFDFQWALFSVVSAMANHYKCRFFTFKIRTFKPLLILVQFWWTLPSFNFCLAMALGQSELRCFFEGWFFRGITTQGFHQSRPLWSTWEAPCISWWW